MPSTYRISPLDPESERGGFHCGVEALDRYFRERVTQDIRRRITNCFVARDKQNRIAGFYTLAATSVLLADLPEVIARKLPRYPTVPAIRMGRLAVDQVARGQGLGAALLADALSRSIDSEIAGFALVVDAKDDDATAFYRHHGFIPFADQPRTLFLPLATARAVRR
jgi:ribosomal protein S18 acetylase RimI-like enzyme